MLDNINFESSFIWALNLDTSIFSVKIGVFNTKILEKIILSKNTAKLGVLQKGLFQIAVFLQSPQFGMNHVVSNNILW